MHTYVVYIHIFRISFIMILYYIVQLLWKNVTIGDKVIHMGHNAFMTHSRVTWLFRM